jgi:hypothetical protein
VCGGATLVFPEQTNVTTPELIGNLEAATLIDGLPGLMRRLAQESAQNPSALQNVRTFFVGGDTVEPALLPKEPLSIPFIRYRREEATVGM